MSLDYDAYSLDSDTLLEHMSSPLGEQEGQDRAALVALIAGNVFKEAIEAVPNEYWVLSHEEMVRIARPSMKETEMKDRFQRVTLAALREGGQVKPSSIYDGIMTKQSFYEMIRRPAKLAYILSPAQSLDLHYRELMYSSISAFREVMMLPLRDKDGKVDQGVMKARMTGFELAIRYLEAGGKLSGR